MPWLSSSDFISVNDHGYHWQDLLYARHWAILYIHFHIGLTQPICSWGSKKKTYRLGGPNSYAESNGLGCCAPGKLMSGGHSYQSNMDVCLSFTICITQGQHSETGGHWLLAELKPDINWFLEVCLFAITIPEYRGQTKWILRLTGF